MEDRAAKRLRNSATPVACSRQNTTFLNCLPAANRLQVKTGCIRAPLRPLYDSWGAIMSTGYYLLAIVLLVALAGIFWRIYSSSARTRAQRKQALRSREAVRQPWDHDKDGGRGNR